jgi:hypothetical protein
MRNAQLTQYQAALRRPLSNHVMSECLWAVFGRPLRADAQRSSQQGSDQALCAVNAPAEAWLFRGAQQMTAHDGQANVIH